MSSTFGTLFKVSTFGESRYKAVGVVVDGCPPKMELSENDIREQMNRSRPGMHSHAGVQERKKTANITKGLNNAGI